VHDRNNHNLVVPSALPPALPRLLQYYSTTFAHYTPPTPLLYAIQHKNIGNANVEDDDDDDVYPRETPPHTKTARAQPPDIVPRPDLRPTSIPT